jgi:hypothetical protein
VVAPLAPPPQAELVLARLMAELLSPLAAAIAMMPGLAARLMAEHVDDGTGRCRLCPLGGQAGHQQWPCRIHSAAAEASRVPPRRQV